MATEIVTLKVNEEFTTEVCKKGINLFGTPPGFRSVSWGPTVEEPNTLIWFITWDSVEAHEEFTKSPAFAVFADFIRPFCTAPISFFHTHLPPSPPTKVFQANVVELVTFPKKPNLSGDLIEKARDSLLDHTQKSAGYHSHSVGIKHEDPNVYVMLVGWDSVEAHVKTQSNEEMSQVRRELKDVAVMEEASVLHVKLQPQ